jgi:hypothetical protein
VLNGVQRNDVASEAERGQPIDHRAQCRCTRAITVDAAQVSHLCLLSGL